MRDYDNLKEPQDRNLTRKNYGRLVAVAILIICLAGAAFLLLKSRVPSQKEAKKESAPIPVVKKNPEEDLTFYKNLKDKGEKNNKKDSIVGLIPPAPSSGTEASIPAPQKGPVSTRFTLQVASMKDYQKALRFSEKLAKEGFPSYVISAEIPEKGTYYRVRIGHYTTRKAAEVIQAELKRKGEREAILARESVVAKQ